MESSWYYCTNSFAARPSYARSARANAARMATIAGWQFALSFLNGFPLIYQTTCYSPHVASSGLSKKSTLPSALATTCQELSTHAECSVYIGDITWPQQKGMIFQLWRQISLLLLQKTSRLIYCGLYKSIKLNKHLTIMADVEDLPLRDFARIFISNKNMATIINCEQAKEVARLQVKEAFSGLQN